MGFACIVLLKLCTFAACETKLRRNPQDFYWKNKHGWIHVHVVAYFTNRNSSQTTLVVSMWCRMWGKSMLVSFQWWDKRNLTYCHAPRLQFIYMSLFVKEKNCRRWWSTFHLRFTKETSAVPRGKLLLLASKPQILLLRNHPVMVKLFIQSYYFLPAFNLPLPFSKPCHCYEWVMPHS